MQPVTLSKVLSHVTLHPLMKTFTQWHQFLHVLIRTRKMSFQVPYQKERIFSLSSDQQPRFILINKFFQQFSITGLQNVSSTNFEYRQIHHNLRIHFGIHHDALHECFIHHDVLNHFFIHHDVLNQFFVHHDVLVTFASFSNPSESSDLFDMSNSQRIHLIHFSWDLRHLLLDAAPKLLRCNDFFVHSSRGMHPKQKFVRRHQHDLSSAQVRTPANFESPLAGYARATHGSEDADAFGASCSNRTVFLNLSCCSSLAASGSLWLTWTSLILFSSCWLSMMSPPDASACRTATCSSSVFPRSSGTSPAPRSIRALLFSFTRSVSAILSLHVSIVASPVKVFSSIVLVRSRNSSWRGFVAFPCDVSNAYPGQPPTGKT